MIKTIYKQLFEVAVGNFFYQNEKNATTSDPVIVEDFSISPSYLTASLLKHNGLVFRQKPSGFMVMAQVNENPPSFFSVSKKIDLTTKLTFFLTLKNANVLSFSEVSSSKLSIGQSYYINNLKNNADARDTLRLSNHITLNETDMIKIRPSNFNFQHNGLINVSTVKIISIDSTQPVLSTITANQSNGKTNLKFDLSNLAEGRYQLEISGAIIEVFYYSGNVSNIFGVIEIFFDGTAANYQIIEHDNSLTNMRPVYQIKLDRRKTFWRFVLNMTTNSLATPKIEVPDGSINFVMTSPSTKKQVFTSTSVVDSVENPLAQFNSNFRVMLKDGLIEKIASLPIPKTIKEESNQFYTETIINI